MCRRFTVSAGLLGPSSVGVRSRGGRFHDVTLRWPSSTILSFLYVSVGASNRKEYPFCILFTDPNNILNLIKWVYSADCAESVFNLRRLCFNRGLFTIEETWITSRVVFHPNWKQVIKQVALKNTRVTPIRSTNWDPHFSLLIIYHTLTYLFVVVSVLHFVFGHRTDELTGKSERTTIRDSGLLPPVILCWWRIEILRLFQSWGTNQTDIFLFPLLSWMKCYNNFPNLIYMGFLWIL